MADGEDGGKSKLPTFFLENNKASSVLTALGVRVQKSMEQDTGSGMIPLFLKAVREILFLNLWKLTT